MERSVVAVDEAVDSDGAEVVVADGEAVNEVIGEALTDLETDNSTEEAEVTKRKCKLSLHYLTTFSLSLRNQFAEQFDFVQSGWNVDVLSLHLAHCFQLVFVWWCLKRIMIFILLGTSWRQTDSSNFLSLCCEPIPN